MADHVSGPLHVEEVDGELWVVATTDHRYLALVGCRDRFPDDRANAELFASAPRLKEQNERLKNFNAMLAEIIRELVERMGEYEMDVDEPPPHRHRLLMRRARSLLAAQAAAEEATDG